MSLGILSVVYDYVVVAYHTLILFWVVWAGHTVLYHVIVHVIDNGTILLCNDFKHLQGKSPSSAERSNKHIFYLRTKIMRKLLYMSVNLFI